MSGPRKTVIVTGASQGIGAGIVNAFVERGWSVVANSRKVTQSTEVVASSQVALVDGHIGESATAARVVETALARFQSIDALVNNAGIFFTKPFTDYTAEDFRSLVATNLEGFLYITQLAIKQMLAQKTGGSIVTITAALARNPVRGVPAAVPMITKGGLETVTQHLAMEYAKDGIRVNAVAPGVVTTPMHRETPKDVMESLSPMGRPSTVKDITDAVLYLTDAATVTGDILTGAMRPGTYLRIVVEGDMGAGDTIRVVERPDHDLTIRDVFRIYTRDRAETERLLAVPGMSESWRRWATDWLQKAERRPTDAAEPGCC